MPWVKQGVALQILLFLVIGTGGAAGIATSLQAQQATVARQVGVIKNINGNTITLTTDQGTDLIVQVASNAAMVRVAPGQTDLKNAAPIQLSDLHVGDRILVRGQPSSDAKSFAAVGVISMSRSDVEAKQRQDREDWQRGIGGLVNALDPTNRTITISVAAVGGVKAVIIQTAAGTILRRYPPDSIQFDEAKPAPFDQIRPGDQLRARGTRSADGSEFTATEIVSGSFRNISGTIRSIDQNASTLTVMDLATKKPFLVKVTAKSQLRSLPPELAQRLAFRLKAAKAGTPNANSSTAPPSGQAANANGGERPAAGGAARPGGGQGGDFQQIVNRTQTVALTDFKKDDAVMIVAAEGTDSGQVTAITVLGGVEPILAAAPAGSQEMALSPWSLGGSTGEDSP
jgi:Domain of unknown function (DUF5666)